MFTLFAKHFPWARFDKGSPPRRSCNSSSQRKGGGRVGSGAVEVGSAVTVSDPFGLSLSEYLTVSSVSRSRSSNRMCDFLASGFRTRGTALLHTVKPGFAFAQAVKRHLYLPRIYKVARPMANRYPLLYLQRALELRSLRSTIITRFIATTDLSATRRSPACSSRIAGWDLSSRHGGLPMLTRFSFEHMSTALPRRPDPVRMLLASRASSGLRPSLAGSTLTLTFSRPIRRSFIFQPVSSLDRLFATFLRQRLRPLPLPAVTSPAASGWSNSYRVGYLPHGVTRPFHGAPRILVKNLVDLLMSRYFAPV